MRFEQANFTNCLSYSKHLIDAISLFWLLQASSTPFHSTIPGQCPQFHDLHHIFTAIKIYVTQLGFFFLGLGKNRNMHLVFNSLLLPQYSSALWWCSFGFCCCLLRKPSDIWYSADFRAHLLCCGKYMQKKKEFMDLSREQFLLTNRAWGSTGCCLHYHL